MKKIFLFAAAVVVSLSISAQKQMHIWVNGNAINLPISQVDSVTFTDSNASTPDIPEPDPNPDPSPGIGVFSVSADKQVTFSKGNLQYTQSTNTWAFAENQYNVIGAANVSNGALADKIDLFGWSADNTTAPFGVSTIADDMYYSGSFVDWGTNQVGSDAPNTWRTLTYDEWNYLRWERPNFSKLCGVAQVNGVNGLILLPDSWTCPLGVTFKSGFHNENKVETFGQYQTFTVEQWSKLEAAGAVFLPSSGYRYGSDVKDVQIGGEYWSASEVNNDRTYVFNFYSHEANMYSRARSIGRCIRLVKDIEGGGATPDTPDTPDTPTEPEEPTDPSPGIGTFSVSADKQVTFSKGNLQYHPAKKQWRFAEEQNDYIGNENSNCSSTPYSWLDLFGWSGSTGSAKFGVSTSEDYDDYSGSFVDWGTNKIGNDAPNTWRTLTYDEWYYLRYDRTNANDLVGVARVNGVNGLILLPDNWTCPSGITFKSGFHSERGADYYAAYQTFTAAEWSKLEAAGAVFLPAAGYRSGTFVGNVRYDGYYWSATEYDGFYVYFLYFDSDEADMYGVSRKAGRSVRLVKDL